MDGAMMFCRRGCIEHGAKKKCYGEQDLYHSPPLGILSAFAFWQLIKRRLMAFFLIPAQRDFEPLAVVVPDPDGHRLGSNRSSLQMPCVAMPGSITP